MSGGGFNNFAGIGLSGCLRRTNESVLPPVSAWQRSTRLGLTRRSRRVERKRRLQVLDIGKKHHVGLLMHANWEACPVRPGLQRNLQKIPRVYKKLVVPSKESVVCTSSSHHPWSKPWEFAVADQLRPALAVAPKDPNGLSRRLAREVNLGRRVGVFLLWAPSLRPVSPCDRGSLHMSSVNLPGCGANNLRETLSC